MVQQMTSKAESISDLTGRGASARFSAAIPYVGAMIGGGDLGIEDTQVTMVGVGAGFAIDGIPVLPVEVHAGGGGSLPVDMSGVPVLSSILGWLSTY